MDAILAVKKAENIFRRDFDFEPNTGADDRKSKTECPSISREL